MGEKDNELAIEDVFVSVFSEVEDEITFTRALDSSYGMRFCI
jgi:hypothetical protein